MDEATESLGVSLAEEPVFLPSAEVADDAVGSLWRRRVAKLGLGPEHHHSVFSMRTSSSFANQLILYAQHRYYMVRSSLYKCSDTGVVPHFPITAPVILRSLTADPALGMVTGLHPSRFGLTVGK